MPQSINIKYNKKPCYDVVIEKGFSHLKDSLKTLEVNNNKCLIVTDSNVEPLYLNKVKDIAAKEFKEVITITLEAGENSKNMDSINNIIDLFIKNDFSRKDYCMALGGGVIGDISGFASSIYKRGLNLIQLPTTLLSCVDSSIGGKNGVNVGGYKNMLGTFYMPKLVYIAVNSITSLTARQYYSGMGEVMKYGLIQDASFYEWILSNMYEIFDLDESVLEEMIAHCITLKQRVVEADPHETLGLRQILNFGHTVGHAIEKQKNFELLHGECVALGSVCAAFISWKRDMISKEDFYEIRDMFVPFNLPISISDINPDELIEIMKNDKKSDSEGIKMVLLKKLGKAVSNEVVTEEEIKEAISEIYFSDDDMKE